MMYNPNNVAPEASPLTSLIEYEVGQDLCETLGYNRQISSGPKADYNPNTQPMGWGHITCGGSIANLESMWYVVLLLIPSIIYILILCA